MRSALLRSVAFVCLIALAAAGSAGVAEGATATIVVDSKGDSNTRDGVLTLREALLLATGGLTYGELTAQEKDNVTGTPGPGSDDTIQFNVGVFPPGSPATIALGDTLPELSTGSDTVDGSAAGVIVSGASPGLWCFIISSDDNVIQGLQIRDCQNAIGILEYYGSHPERNRIGGAGPGQGNVIVANVAGVAMYGGRANLVVGNYIGTDAGGSPGLGNGTGVEISSASDNTVGGDSPDETNVISGNYQDGVRIESGASHNRVIGNRIGTNEAGTAAIPNGNHGVSIWFGASNNTIGGWRSGERNIISGNGGDGVNIWNAGTSGNRVLNNRIGTDAGGLNALPNSGAGVSMGQGAQNTRIDSNLISGNGWVGVNISDFDPTAPAPAAYASGNQVTENLIGTDSSGTAALPNGEGVNIWNAPNNLIGTGNVISGNGGAGVHISGSDSYGDVVGGNLIGLTADGADALPNGGSGVVIDQGAHDNSIGASPAAGGTNTISGNGMAGVTIDGSDTSGNRVVSNVIGINPSGDGPLPNNNGVWISNGAHDNTIGGPGGERNLISGNTGWGVVIGDGGANNNQVIGNNIGTGWDGGVAIPNDVGVVIWSGAQGNTIGPDNLISFNTNGGVGFVFGGTTGNRLIGNTISMNGAAGVGGVYGSGGNTIGGPNPGEGNVISANAVAGVRIAGDSSGFVVMGNFIGTDFSGVGPWSNDGPGVLVESGAHHNAIGGTGPGEGNVIAFNNGDGVRVDGGNTSNNTIRGNSSHSNGGMGIENINGGNSEIPGPNILSQNPITGTTCPRCTVDIYTDHEDEGRYYEGSVVAGIGGNFTFAGVLFGPWLTATTTDTFGNTSEFTAPAPVIDTGDDDHDGVPNYLDACPTVAEDIDAYQDGDGCPDPDNDGDGFPDFTDQCPGTDGTVGDDGVPCTDDTNEINTCEDYDGVLDTDGCHDSPGDDYDGDGLLDEEEVFTYRTDADNPDTDGDDLSDGGEVDTYGTCPADEANLAELPQCVGVADARDTDGGGVWDGEEVARGTSPLDPSDDYVCSDCDGDGCVAEEEAFGAPDPKPGFTCATADPCYSDSRWYDFYDVPVPAVADPAQNGPRDGAVAMDDVLSTLFYFGTVDGDAGDPNSNGVTYDSLKDGDWFNGAGQVMSPDGLTNQWDKVGRRYDRSPGPVPNQPWEAGPPDGAVAMDDVITVLAQMGLDCSGPP